MIRLPVDRLKPHPLATSLIPPMSDEEFSALVESISKVGIKKPLDVIERGDEYLVVDGTHRLRAALALGLRRVPANVLVMKDEEVEDYIITIQNARRNLTPHQKAALALEWMERHGKPVDHAARKFGVSKKLIAEVEAVKKENPEFYRLIRSGGVKPKDIREYLRAGELSEKEKESLIPALEVEDRIEQLEQEKALLQEELEKEKKQKEDLRNLKKRLRRLEKEREELKEVVKSLYAVAKDRTSCEYQEAAKREDVMQILSLVPERVDVEAAQGEQIPVTEDHRKAEVLAETCVSFLRETSTQLLDVLLRVDTLPVSLAEKINELLKEMSFFFHSISEHLARISLSSEPDTSKKETFLVLKHAATEDSKDKQGS